jgi:hypothetical protein
MGHRRRVLLALAVFFVFPAALMFYAVSSGPPPALEESARPHARLVLHCTRTDGSSPAGGSYSIVGRPRQALPIGFLGEPLRLEGSFEGGLLLVDSLPPMRAEIVVRFESGERMDLVLELEEGLNERSLKP